MEEIIEENIIEKNEAQKPKMTVWRLLAYFIIYSVIGWAIETTFAFFLHGVIESRQSFLYGPFCAIYGVGAVAMITTLHYFDKNNYTLFISGFIVGTITEYLVSYIGELWLDTRWWDYSDNFLNINGRVCFIYSVFWGALAIYLMRSVNPKIDKFIDLTTNKVTKKVFNTIIIIITLFMFIDCLYSAMAENWVLTKVCVEKNLDVKDKNKVQKIYDETYSNETKKFFVDKYWTIEHVLYSYPNLTKQLENGNRVYIKKLYPEIHPYLIRIKPEKKGSIYEP